MLACGAAIVVRVAAGIKAGDLLQHHVNGMKLRNVFLEVYRNPENYALDFFVETVCEFGKLQLQPSPIEMLCEAITKAR